MTNTPETRRVHLPALAVTLLVGGPFLILFGLPAGTVNAELDYQWAITLTLVGRIILCAGVAALVIGITLVGVRSIAQQQVDILLRER
jgi:hypothetical protein